MLLREYINTRGIPVAKLGKRVGITVRQTMHKYVMGQSVPPREVQERIAIETGGLVLPVDIKAANETYRAARAEEKAKALSVKAA